MDYLAEEIEKLHEKYPDRFFYDGEKLHPLFDGSGGLIPVDDPKKGKVVEVVESDQPTCDCDCHDTADECTVCWPVHNEDQPMTENKERYTLKEAFEYLSNVLHDPEKCVDKQRLNNKYKEAGEDLYPEEGCDEVLTKHDEMTEEKAREVLGERFDYIVEFFDDNKIELERDEYTPLELKAIAWWMENKTLDKEDKPDPKKEGNWY